MPKEPEKERNILVVRELPNQQIRAISDDKGDEYNLITIEEALTELIKNVRDIKKSTV